MSFNGTSRDDERDTFQALTEIITVVKDWMDLNRLKMNDTKTEFIFFGSRQLVLDNCVKSTQQTLTSTALSYQPAPASGILVQTSTVSFPLRP